MGGVNLSEESKNILATNAEFIGTQIRSCKDETFLYHGPLLNRIHSLGKFCHCMILTEISDISQMFVCSSILPDH